MTISAFRLAKPYSIQPEERLVHLVSHHRPDSLGFYAFSYRNQSSGSVNLSRYAIQGYPLISGNRC